MIVTKTPLRISFVGGGSDRPSFYSEEPGACVAAAIDKYVYVTVNDKYDGSIRAAYSTTENVTSVDELRHELIREALRVAEVDSGIEIHSIADIPGGTGLGSSSSFTVGLWRALAEYRGFYAGASSLAQTACHIEINRCHKPIGKQDQYAAAFGGLNLYGFTSKGVTVSPIECDYEALSAYCLLLDTGRMRVGDAGQVLAKQQQNNDAVCELAKGAPVFADELAQGNFERCGKIMALAWQVKRKFCANAQIDAWYETAKRAGAWGGKLCGAGGGGFLLFLAPPERHAAIIRALQLRHVPIRVSVKGCEVVYASV